MTSVPASSPSPSPAKPLLPWGLVARIMSVFALPMTLAAILVGPGPAAALVLGGVLPGFGAMAMGKRPVAIGAMAALLLATGGITILPLAALAWAIALLLACGAGWEASRHGGRAFVLALVGFVAVFLIPSMPSSGTALPLMAVGIVWGWLSTRWLQFEGRLAPPPRGARFGISLAIFLFAGLVISASVTQWIEQYYAYWVVLLFVFRALSPDQGANARLVRYAAGTIVGGLVALLVSFLPLPALVTLGVAMPLGALSLRYIAQPTPVSAAASTACILLVMPVGADDILFRVEAVLGVVLIAGALGFVLSAGWRLVDPAEPTG